MIYHATSHPSGIFSRSLSLTARSDKDLKSIASRVLNGRIDEIWPSRLKEDANVSDSETGVRMSHTQDVQQAQLQHQHMQMMMLPRLAAAFQVSQAKGTKCSN
jgi:hypothetical protein